MSYIFPIISLAFPSSLRRKNTAPLAPVKDWRGPQGLHHRSLIVLGDLGWNPRQVVGRYTQLTFFEGKVLEIPWFFEGFMTIKGGETLNDVFFLFIPKLAEMIQFDDDFSDGLKPPTSFCSFSFAI